MNNNNKNNKEKIIPMDLFNILNKEVYSYDKFKRLGIFSVLNDFKIIVSLQLSKFSEANLSKINNRNNNSNSNSNNLICSSVFYMGGISFEAIVNELTDKDYSNDLHILNVSWIRTMELSELDEIHVQEYQFTNIFNNDYKLYVHNMSYSKFFKSLNMLFEFRSDHEKINTGYLGINPIIIFNGMSMGNITHLFKLHNFNLNGGTITRRHKLSLFHYRLSLFLYLSNLFKDNKQGYLDNYQENLFSSKFVMRKGEINPYISQYKIINNYYKLQIEIFDKEIEVNNKYQYIEQIKSKIHSLESEHSSNLSSIDYNMQNISYLKKKLVDGISMKHKASLTGRIKNYNDDINKFKGDNLKIDRDLPNLNKNLPKDQDYLNRIKNELNNLKLELMAFKSKVIGLENSNNNMFVDNSKINSSEINNDSSNNNINNNLNSNSDIEINTKVSNVSNNNISNNESNTENNSISNSNTNSDTNPNTISKIGINTDNNSYIKSYTNKTNNINNSGNRGYHTLTKTSIKKINFSINSPIFIELQRILNNSPLDRDTQMKIEQFLNNQGQIFLKNKIDQNTDINYYRINNNIIEYLKKSILELEKLIDNYRSNISIFTNKDNSDKVEYILITRLSNEIIISHLLGRLLRIISNNNLFNHNTTCTDLANDLGHSLLGALYSQDYNKIEEETHKLGLNNFIKNEYSELNNLASDAVLIQIGLKLLNFLVEVDLIKSEIYILGKDHKSHIYTATTKIQEDLGKNLGMLNISYKIPMIVPPKEYGYDYNRGTEILGGYLLNDREYIIPLIIKNQELKEQSQIKDQNVIFNTVNNLSSVGYKINTPVLNFILEYGLEFNLISDHNLKHPLEIKKMEKKKLTVVETKNLASFLSKKQLEMNILGLALIFKNVPEFFIPVRLDNRGRVYCMVDYLQYQGIELAKSLLLFSKGEKINKWDKKSIDFLKIFGANCYGNGINKKSYNDRVEWVNKNENDILNFRNGKLIKDADSKLLFIAFCFEYLNYHNSLFNSDNFYISHFPIQLDATCNGYQHLSLLTGDEPLAGQLNLISGDENSIPNDFYSFVALKVNDYLKTTMLEEKNKLNKYSKDTSTVLKENDSLTIIESCERLLTLNKSRSLVKLPIMVKPYNASHFKMVEYIKESFEMISKYSNNVDGLYEDTLKEFNTNDKVFYSYNSNKQVKLNNFDLNLFISTMEKVIYNEFPKLKEFNSYLNKVAEICSILNITITWTVPSGLEVKQYYVDSEAIRLKPFKYKKSTFTLKLKTDKINKNKQIRALMPNLIHSLDAASLSLIIDMFYLYHNDENNKFNFFSIHDCFAVTANNITNLIKFIKLVYIKIYSEDSYLLKFDEGIINSIKYQFGNNSFNDETKIISVNGLNLQYPNVKQVILGKIKAAKIMKSQSIIN